MCSVQSQHSYIAIEVLLNHLNDITESNPKIKTSLLEALGEAIIIAAGGAIGIFQLTYHSTYNTNEMDDIDIHVSYRFPQYFNDTILHTRM